MGTPESGLPTQVLDRGVIVIAGSTVLSGLLQIAKPGFVLRFIGAKDSPANRHLFGTVGMFMVVVGGALLHALLLDRGARRLILGWACLQKIGAATAVAIGVVRGVFSPIALLVAGCDVLSCLLIAWRRTREGPR